MVNVIKQEVRMEESLRKRLEFICEFCRVKPTIINGNLRTIDKTNLTYLEPHRIIINDITFLAFNYSNDIIIENLKNKIKLSEMIIDLNGIQTSVPVRYSEYTSIKDVMQNFYRLNECYEVNLYKGTFYKDTEKLDIGPLQRNEVPIRVFPLQKDNNGDKDWLSMGMLATKNNPNDIKVNIRDVFETIPDNVTEEDF